MEKDVRDIIRRCGMCQVTESHTLPYDLYTSLLVPTLPWVDVTMPKKKNLHILQNFTSKC